VLGGFSWGFYVYLLAVFGWFELAALNLWRLATRG
jgi:hypothetical protein